MCHNSCFKFLRQVDCYVAIVISEMSDIQGDVVIIVSWCCINLF